MSVHPTASASWRFVRSTTPSPSASASSSRATPAAPSRRPMGETRRQDAAYAECAALHPYADVLPSPDVAFASPVSSSLVVRPMSFR
jgi:hypothetical protein